MSCGLNLHKHHGVSTLAGFFSQRYQPPFGSTAPPGPVNRSGMKFSLIDHVLEQSPDRIRAIKHVTTAEEYLADHFPGFPVLPGVLMIEAVVQAARLMLAKQTDDRLVLGEVRALKYGSFVRPGETLDVVVTLSKTTEESYVCKALGRVVSPAAAEPPELPSETRPEAVGTGTAGESTARSAETAVSGRFIMRTVRTFPPPAVAPQ